MTGKRAKAGTPHIGILGRRRDAEVQALEAALTQRGCPVTVVDFSGFPHLNLATLGERLFFDDVMRAGVIPLDRFDLWVLRSVCFDGPTDDRVSGAQSLRELCRRQVAGLVVQHALVARLGRQVPVVNPARSFRFHREKAYQHALLRRHGIATPRAMITRDPARARAFVDQLDGRAVAKPLTSAAEVVMADEAFFAEAGERIRRRPFMFQQYVTGRALRVYLLGGAVVSASEIHYDRRFVDWRERTERLTPYELEADTAVELGRLARLLELPYCGLDVEWDERTAQHYVLDVNPAALFVGYGRLAGCDMAGLIARYLLQVIDRGGDPWVDTPAASAR